MAFIETPTFPVNVSFGSKSSPRWSTSIIEVGGGFEKRNQNWNYPLLEFDVAYGIRSVADLYAVMEYYMACRGRIHSFRYKDWLDYKTVSPDQAVSSGDVRMVTTTEPYTLANGDNSTTQFQLALQYNMGNQQLIRAIKKPVDGTILVKIDTTDQTEGVDYTIDYTTGVVTFTSAPGVGQVLYWGGEFDVPVRFDTDNLETNYIAYEQGGQTIPLKEVRI